MQVKCFIYEHLDTSKTRSEMIQISSWPARKGPQGKMGGEISLSRTLLLLEYPFEAVLATNPRDTEGDGSKLPGPDLTNIMRSCSTLPRVQTIAEQLGIPLLEFHEVSDRRDSPALIVRPGVVMLCSTTIAVRHLTS